MPELVAHARGRPAEFGSDLPARDLAVLVVPEFDRTAERLPLGVGEVVERRRPRLAKATLALDGDGDRARDVGEQVAERRLRTDQPAADAPVVAEPGRRVEDAPCSPGGESNRATTGGGSKCTNTSVFAPTSEVR